MTATAKWLAFGQRWLIFVLCILAWQWIASAAASAFFPPPTEIAEAMYQLWLSGPPSRLFLGDSVFADVLPSLGRMLGAWLVAVIIGVTAGIGLGLAERFSGYAMPVLAFMRALPPIMLVPLFLDLFRIGTPMQLATIAFGSIWPVLLNAVDGARSVDRTKIDTVRAFRIGRVRWVCEVVLPAALPKIFAGLRLSLQFALILMVFAEYVGSTNGIGFRLFRANGVFEYPIVWAAIVMMGLIGYLLNRLLLVAEHRLLGWHYSAMRVQKG